MSTYQFPKCPPCGDTGKFLNPANFLDATAYFAYEPCPFCRPVDYTSWAVEQNRIIDEYNECVEICNQNKERQGKKKKLMKHVPFIDSIYYQANRKVPTELMYLVPTK
jgi:Zn ribbon nucleic-acid-binding protein